MKKILGLFMIISLSFGASAAISATAGKSIKKLSTADKSADGIHFFKGTWEEALAKAKKENKIIFLDAYASWCGPCKMMAINTFTKKDVGEIFNANFINVKMDMEKDPNGARLSGKYKLRAYPTLYFVNGSEEIVHETVGALKPKQLISIGEEVIEKL